MTSTSRSVACASELHPQRQTFAARLAAHGEALRRAVAPAALAA
jgi:hypothetical protein